MSTEKFCLASEAKVQRKDNSSSQGKPMTCSQPHRLLTQSLFSGASLSMSLDTFAWPTPGTTESKSSIPMEGNFCPSNIIDHVLPRFFIFQLFESFWFLGIRRCRVQGTRRCRHHVERQHFSLRPWKPSRPNFLNDDWSKRLLTNNSTEKTSDGLVLVWIEAFSLEIISNLHFLFYLFFKGC